MTLNESKWIGSTLVDLAKKNKLSSLLNIGSSTGYFRKVQQPQIHNHVFAPLEELGVKIVHTDMKEAEGVDLVGDIMEEAFFNKVKEKRFDKILCSNLLEHVRNPSLLAKRIASISNEGQYILITVPYLYPYHNDPIDNNLRPTVEELAAMFPNTKLIKGEVVVSDNTFINMLKKNKRLFALTSLRLFLPFYKPSSYFQIWRDYIHCNEHFSTSCVLLQKIK